MGLAAVTMYKNHSRINTMRQLRVEQGTEISLHPIRGNTIYGHVHMAKTGGTNLNGMLALNYERVCGHKGNSFDAYLSNERVRNGGDWRRAKDSYNKWYGPMYSRNRVPLDTQLEIGFEDCDFISEEVNWEFWYKFKSFHDMSLELHVPCRDPIGHLLSQCNHQELTFNCDADNMNDEVEKCLMSPNRFSMQLVRQFNVKCYDYDEQFTGYMEYITSKLDTKRIQSEYISRINNRVRERVNECIWERAKIKHKVLEILLNHDYYRFCDKCLKSSNNLLRLGNTA